MWRKVTLIVGAVVLLAVLALSLTPTGQMAVRPHDPVDLEGRVDIDRQRADKIQGRLSFIGVDDQEVRLLHKWWLALRDDDVSFVPVPTEDKSSRSRAIATDDPSDSNALTLAKRVASGIAFDLADQKVHWSGTNVAITGVEPGSPAAMVGMQSGDSLISINGTDVDNSVDAGKMLYAREPGSRVQLVVRRAGQDREVTVETATPPAGDTVHQSVIGAALDTIGLQVGLPKSVSIDSGGVVGTSGALAFALYVYDAISDGDLAKGRSIVATGALTVDGAVKPVQRLRQKAIATQRAGADLLLVPVDNVGEAVKGVREACRSDVRCVKVVPVSSVQNAVELLDDPDKLAAVQQSVRND
jgi:PDZ domain-containing secreted protein